MKKLGKKSRTRYCLEIQYGIRNGMEQYIKNKMESEWFGLPVHRVAPSTESKDFGGLARPPEGISILKTKKVSDDAREWLLKNEWFLAETQLKLMRPKGIWFETPENHRKTDAAYCTPHFFEQGEICPFDELIVQDALDFAIKLEGHYHKNPWLDKEKATGAYANWISSLVQKKCARLVIEFNGTPMAVHLSTRLDATTIDGHLAVTRKNAVGKGITSSLADQASEKLKRYMFENDIHTACASTNEAAFKFNQMAGYKWVGTDEVWYAKR
jgi:hypothetical protein